MNVMNAALRSHEPESSTNVSNTPTHASFVGSIPQTYDLHLGPLLFEFSAADLARRVAAQLPDARHVVEIACGTGISTFHLWRALAPETKILATDLNEAMLDYARENRSVLGNVSFQQADAQALDYADNAFDALVCQFGVMFFPDKARAMSEFARVLRPGGLLAFNVWGSLAENRVAEIAQTTIESFFESDPPDFLRVPFGFSDPEPIQQLLQDAGFHDHQFEIVEETIECADAVSIARGFVEGNPGILQIRERAICDPEDVVQAVAGAIEAEYGPAPLQIPLREIVILARKP